VSFVVQDNGRGFAPDLAGTEGKGMGLMRAAADAIGGKFEVAARIGNGTRVVVVFQTKRA
jgi:signal transduction histidine kinase